MSENSDVLHGDSRTQHPFGDPDHRWGLIAVLRQAIIDLENGKHVNLVEGQLQRVLAVVRAGIDA